MGPSLRRQFISAATAQVFSQAVNIASQILIVPILIATWGAEKYGVWLVVSAVPAYFSLVDLGFAQVSGNEMTMRLARGDHEGAITVAHTAWFLTGSACTAVVLLMTPAALLLQVSGWFPLPHGFSENIGLSLLFLVLSVVVSLSFGVVSACLRSFGLSYVMIIANSTARLAMLAVQIGAALLGLGFLGCSIATFAANLIVLFVFSFNFFKRQRSFLPSFNGIDFRLLRSLIWPSMSYFSYTLSRAINIQGTAMAVGFVLGPTAVVITSSIRTFTQLGRIAAQIAPFAMEPVFAQLYGRNDARSRPAFARLVLMNGIGTVIYVIVMLVFGEKFLSVWTHRAVVGQTALFHMGLIAVVLEIFWFTWQTPYVATNKHSMFAWFLLAFSILALAILPITASTIGLPAVGLNWVGLNFAVLIATAVVAFRLRRR